MLWTWSYYSTCTKNGHEETWSSTLHTTVNVQKSAHRMYQHLRFGSDISAVTAKDLLVLGINVNIKVLFKAFWYDACEWRTSLLQRLLKIHEEMPDTYTCTMYLLTRHPGVWDIKVDKFGILVIHRMLHVIFSTH